MLHNAEVSAFRLFFNTAVLIQCIKDWQKELGIRMGDADSGGSQDCDYNNIGLCTGRFKA